ARVVEYVVVELDPDHIHWFIRRGDHFEDLPPGPDGIYRSEIFPGLWLDADALFSADRGRLIRILRRGLATPGDKAVAARRARQARSRGGAATGPHPRHPARARRTERRRHRKLLYRRTRVGHRNRPFQPPL